MSEYVLFTDMDADLTQPMVDEMGIEVVPMRFAVDGKEYYNYPDSREMDIKDFYVKLRGGASTTTSQTNTEEYAEYFRPFLANGKDVLYLGFSSGLSGTVNAAKMAVEELEAEFPGRKVMVVDTLCASIGQACIVWYAAGMKKDGKPMEEVAKWVEDNRKKLAHWVTVDDLQFLKRGGRLSAGAALMGTMLSIKPILKMDDEGKLGVVDKVRGRKNAIARLVDEMEKTAVDPADQVVFIAHADCEADAALLADEVKKRCGAKEVRTHMIGPVVGGHSGPNTLALFFFATGR